MDIAVDCTMVWFPPSPGLALPTFHCSTKVSSLQEMFQLAAGKVTGSVLMVSVPDRPIWYHSASTKGLNEEPGWKPLFSMPPCL